MAIGKEKFNTGWEEDALLHRKTLFVVAACNPENVAFPFITQGVTRHFLGYFLVIEDTASGGLEEVEMEDM